MKNDFERPASSEQKEFGSNVEIMLKFIRHGERTKDGKLTDYGRSVTAERAKESGINAEDFDAVKAVGSNAGSKNSAGMGRSLETADIYARGIAGDEQFETRAPKVLNYETFINKVPFDWTEIYDTNLPKDFEFLPDEEKAIAAKKAQTATVNYLIALDTPEARAMKEEAAGSFAFLIDHYAQMAKRLKSESKVLMPAGTHGGVMEFLLQQALIRKDKNGKDVVGFEDINEIGGEFSPSEAYNIDIATNEEGDIGELKVSFDNAARPALQDAHLDIAKLKELRESYVTLHGLNS